ncbi:MAG: hypothetical protein LUC34_05880, partial [Campylobacter sp.]|nr:hypothetical protein [Campylobacter sp.]
SGDDMTAVCSADVAIEFTRSFMENFEKLSKDFLSRLSSKTDEKLPPKLTMCAGIAFCNEKYPFHYAVNLAEALCGVAKKDSKGKYKDKSVAPSCLMFHNIQSSNYQNWDKFKKDELTISNEQGEIYCDFGPYYLDQDGEPHIEDLLNLAKAYKAENSPKSKLREWLKELGISRQYANNMLDRIVEVMRTGEREKFDGVLKGLHSELGNANLIIEKDTKHLTKNSNLIAENNEKEKKYKTPIYDILQILSVSDEIPIQKADDNDGGKK